MAAIVLTGILGCSSKETVTDTKSSEEQVSAEQPVKEITAETVQEEEVETENIQGEVLAGVYSNGYELVEVPMGMYFEGEQKVFCKVKMPVNYRFYADYTTEEGDEKTIGEASGGNSLALCIERGLWKEPYAISSVLLGLGSESLRFFTISTEQGTMEDIKAIFPDAVEIGTQEHPGIYYVDSDEASTADINVEVYLNENFHLIMRYEGPLAEELGLDQLARNIYDLVTVVE